MSERQALEAHVAALLGEPLRVSGYDLEAVEITPAGKRRVLRVAVDKDGGITLDDVADATRVVNDTLDGSDAMGEQPYTLEVTSRGVERPLSLPRHWRRNAKRLVRVTLADGSTVEGRVQVADDDETGGVTLDLAGDVRIVPYAQVVKALVQVEFKRADTDDEGDESDEGDETGEA
jgi:ribosome maturation factor RimP